MKKLCLSLLIGIAACGGKPAPKTTADTTTPAKADDPTCPLIVPGTSVSVEDTPVGASLMFVTTGDAAAVRTRATALATMHNKHDGPGGAMGMMFPAAWQASAQEIEGGARVDFAGKTEADGPKISEELRMHASHLTGGSCAM